MFGLSIGHLVILLVVVLLFGARRLPELGEGLGRGMKAFKDAMEGKARIDKPADRPPGQIDSKDREK